MVRQPYKRPPITEAVIHVVFGTALSTGDLEKANNNLAQFYPQHQHTRNVSVQVDLPPKPDLKPITRIPMDELGHRRSSNDQTQILIIWPTSLVFSQLAPYPGWDDFFGRFVRDWALWKRIVGYRNIIRVGVRYINRIDIPIIGPIVEYESFLNTYPHLPEEFGLPITFYSMQVQFSDPEIDGKITINSSSVPSPLLDHASFLFDQDLAKEANLPQNDEGLYKLLEEIHLRKNAVFEACITDRARELFNA